MVKTFRDHQPRVEASEIGNEMDWGAFNGNVVSRDGIGLALAVMQQTINEFQSASFC